MAKRPEPSAPIKATFIEQFGLTFRYTVVCGAVVFVAHYLSEIARVLAGRTTNASIMMSFLADVEFNVWVAWGMAAGGVVYGSSQRMLRRKVIAEQHEHIVQLERQIERRRTSSNLTRHGETNPVDK